MRVRFYVTPGGADPVSAYLDDLPAKEAAIVLEALSDLAESGLEGASVSMRHIEGKLWEIKVSRHRLFYVVVNGPELVVLHAYKKQGQRAPPRELEVARNRMKEVLHG